MTGSMTISSAYDEARERMYREQQEAVDAQVAEGFHPFVMLGHLNKHNLAVVNEQTVLNITYCAFRPWNQSQSAYDRVQLDILKHAEPYWDLAESHFKGKACMLFDVRRDIKAQLFHLKIKLGFTTMEDQESFAVLAKLHDLPEHLPLVY